MKNTAKRYFDVLSMVWCITTCSGFRLTNSLSRWGVLINLYYSFIYRICTEDMAQKGEKSDQIKEH